MNSVVSESKSEKRRLRKQSALFIGQEPFLLQTISAIQASLAFVRHDRASMNKSRGLTLRPQAIESTPGLRLKDLRTKQ